MTSSRACRACLRSAGPLFPLDGALLRHFYRLVELQTQAEEERFGAVCVMCRGCLGALHGAVRLRASALRARSLLGPGPPPPREPPWPGPPPPREPPHWFGLGRSGAVLLNSRDREVVPPSPNIGLLILFESDALHDERMDPDGPDGFFEPNGPEGTLGLADIQGLENTQGLGDTQGLEDAQGLDGMAAVKFEIKEEDVNNLIKTEEFDSLDDLPLALEATEWSHKHKRRKNKERRRKSDGKNKTESKVEAESGSKKKTERRHKVKGKSKTRDKDKNKGASRMVLETDEYTVIKLEMAEVEAARQATLASARFQSAPHRCDLCAKAFNYPDVLAAHTLRHRPAPHALECSLCHQFLPSAVSLRGHLKSHTTKYRCKQCGVVKASRQHLLEHFALQHTSCPRTYLCNVCNKTLTKRTMFQKHMRMHFPASKVTCDKCGKLFKTIETLRAHMLRHADVARYPCDECPKTFRYASLLYSHKVTHLTSQDFYCVECDLRFKTASNLRLHLRKTKAHADSSKMEWACEQCTRRYAGEKQLKAHVAWVHLGLREYECALCQKQFGTRDGLRSHHRKIHDGIRPERSHLCHFCNKAFRAKAVLVKHLRVHTGERPFSCPDCGKKFAQHSTLNTHVRLVHLKLQRTKPRDSHPWPQANHPIKTDTT